MTTYLEVNSANIIAQGKSMVRYTGGDTFDLGEIQSEPPGVTTGVEVISTSFQTSEETMGFNVLGQKSSNTFSFKFTGTVNEIRLFTKNLKLISNYQSTNTSSVTFRYVNTVSKNFWFLTGSGKNTSDSTVSTNFWTDNGIQVMLLGYNINSQLSIPGVLIYTLKLIESKGNT